MVFRTMLESYDFSGKTLVAFNTNGGSGEGDMVKTLRETQPDAKVISHRLDVNSTEVRDCDGRVKRWLRKHNLEPD